MTPAWAQRKDALLSDCMVSPDVFTHMMDRLGDFVAPYQHALEAEAVRAPCPPLPSGAAVPREPQECRGSRPSSRSSDRSCKTSSAPPRGIIGHWSPCWSDNGRAVGRIRWHHRLRSQQLPEARHAFGGRQTAMVRHRGKVDNCQVGVFMGYVSHVDHTLLDFRLSLPEEWVRDEQRRHACHVPPEVPDQTRHAQCLEMLDAWGKPRCRTAG